MSLPSITNKVVNRLQKRNDAARQQFVKASAVASTKYSKRVNQLAEDGFIRRQNLFNAQQQREVDGVQLRADFSEASRYVLGDKTLDWLRQQGSINAPTVTSIFAGIESARADEAGRFEAVLDARDASTARLNTSEIQIEQQQNAADGRILGAEGTLLKQFQDSLNTGLDAETALGNLVASSTLTGAVTEANNVSREANNIRSNDTSAANNQRTTSVSAANNIRSNDTSAANNQRTTSVSAANNIRSNDTSAANNQRTTSVSAANNQRSTSASIGNNQRSVAASIANNQRTTSTSAANNQRTTSVSAANNRRSNEVSSANNQRTTSVSAANNQRSNDTSAANNQRTTSVSAANNQRTTSVSAANNQRTTGVSAANNQRSTAVSGNSKTNANNAIAFLRSGGANGTLTTPNAVTSNESVFNATVDPVATPQQVISQAAADSSATLLKQSEPQAFPDIVTGQQQSDLVTGVEQPAPVVEPAPTPVVEPEQAPVEGAFLQDFNDTLNATLRVQPDNPQILQDQQSLALLDQFVEQPDIIQAVTDQVSTQLEFPVQEGQTVDLGQLEEFAIANNRQGEVNGLLSAAKIYDSWLNGNYTVT